MADRKGRRWEEDGKAVSRVTVGAEEAFELVGIVDASGAQITSFGGGDVGVLTVPAPLSTTGGGTEATALRVTLANDSTGLISVDDNGGSLTVHDNLNRRLLEEILIELRAHNNLLLHLLPKDPQQKDTRPDLKIAR